MSEPLVQTTQPCPGCGHETEPEQDGDHVYFECEQDDCYNPSWGYSRVGESDPDCAIGVPESIRRQASQFDAPVEKTTAVNLGSRIGKRPGL